METVKFEKPKGYKNVNTSTGVKVEKPIDPTILTKMKKLLYKITTYTSQ
jgi:hypothetical protein